MEVPLSVTSRHSLMLAYESCSWPMPWKCKRLWPSIWWMLFVRKVPKQKSGRNPFPSFARKKSPLEWNDVELEATKTLLKRPMFPNSNCQDIQSKLDFVKFLHNPMTRKSLRRNHCCLHWVPMAQRFVASRWAQKGEWSMVDAEMKRGYGPPLSQDVD